jgi:hypothetical protein
MGATARDGVDTLVGGELRLEKCGDPMFERCRVAVSGIGGQREIEHGNHGHARPGIRVLLRRDVRGCNGKGAGEDTGAYPAASD